MKFKKKIKDLITKEVKNLINNNKKIKTKRKKYLLYRKNVCQDFGKTFQTISRYNRYALNKI